MFLKPFVVMNREAVESNTLHGSLSLHNIFHVMPCGLVNFCVLWEVLLQYVGYSCLLSFVFLLCLTFSKRNSDVKV